MIVRVKIHFLGDIKHPKFEKMKSELTIMDLVGFDETFTEKIMDEQRFLYPGMVNNSMELIEDYNDLGLYSLRNLILSLEVPE